MQIPRPCSFGFNLKVIFLYTQYQEGSSILVGSGCAVLTRILAADTLIPNFTVHEMLMYTIELKQERKVPLSEKRSQVDAVIKQLNLWPCKNVLIGSQAKRGISGTALPCQFASPWQTIIGVMNKQDTFLRVLTAGTGKLQHLWYWSEGTD